MTSLNILLMAPPAEGGQGGGGMQLIIMMVLLFAVFYLFIIRPQTKRNKDLKKFREGIKKGDRVITIGGIHGKVLEVADTTVIIETEGQGRLKMEKTAVAMDNSGQDQLQPAK
jgi:preprotein translocase subunit YajC